jgi:hypothetical protein
MNPTVTEYGRVRIVKGRYSGLLGFYDDDCENGRVIVYLEDKPGTYVTVNRSSIVQVLENKNDRHSQLDMPHWLVSGLKKLHQRRY